MERLNLKFSDSEKSLSSDTSSPEEGLMTTTFKTNLRKHNSLERPRSLPKNSTQIFEEKQKVKEPSPKASLKDKINTRFKKFYDNRKFMAR